MEKNDKNIILKNCSGEATEAAIPEEDPPRGFKKDEINFEEYRLSQDFESIVGGKKETLSVPVRKPDRQWWFQVYPGGDWRIPAAIIEIKDDRETYLVLPKLLPELNGECIPKYLFTCITRQGVTFLWPIKMPGADGRLDQWNRSALQIATEYSGRWIRVVPQMVLGAYEVFTSCKEFPQPPLPSENLNSILNKAFKGKIIETLDYPILKRLRGEI